MLSAGETRAMCQSWLAVGIPIMGSNLADAALRFSLQCDATQTLQISTICRCNARLAGAQLGRQFMRCLRKCPRVARR